MNKNPEMVPDDQYEPSVNLWNSPLKYAKQKWIFKRSREVRYTVSSEHVNTFDQRRLIDARFFNLINFIAIMLFNLGAIINPLPGTK